MIRFWPRSNSDARQNGGSSASAPEIPRTSIRPPSGWVSLGLMEVWEYRELVVFLIWRNIKARYAQSVIGIGWAVIQPVATMIVFTVIFGRFFGLPSDGVPYPIFSFTALVPWIYFSRALTGTTSSLTGAGGMISKVYFPRLVIPLSTVLDRLVDFVIALALVFAMMAYFQIAPTIWALTLPAMLAIMVMAAMGAGMWLTSLSVQYRDVNYAMGFAIQLLMYTTPVIYPVSMVPERFHLIYALNPMVGVIEGFRAALLATTPMPWDLIGMSSITAVLLVISGAYFFRRKEQLFADVV